MTREEGLGPATVMMLAGPQMDALVQKLGIDGSTTVVFTHPKGSTDSEHLQPAVAYWTFRYWGFPRERVKMLNGGDDAWDVAGRPLTDAALVPTPSTFSVTSNKVLKDTLRFSVGEILTLVDSINRDRSLLNTWQMLDVRGFTVSPYIANAYRGNGPFQFATDRVNGESTRNRLYPDQATAIARLATLPVMDGTAPVYLSPTKKLISMCGTSFNCAPIFVIFDGILKVAEGNAAMYDGSSTQWNNYSVAKIQAGGRHCDPGEHLGLRRPHRGHVRPARGRNAAGGRPRREPLRSRATSSTRRRRTRRTRSRPPTRPTSPRRAAAARRAAVAASTGGGC